MKCHAWNLNKRLDEKLEASSARSSRLGLWSVGLALVWLGMAGSGLALADAIKLSNNWLKDVEVVGISSGKLVYKIGGSESSLALDKLQGLKLDMYPDVEAATTAMDAGKLDAAQAALAKVLAQTRETWVKQWSQWQLVKVLDKLGKAQDAAETYLLLAQAKADAVLLADMPLASLAGASAQQKIEIARKLEKALPGLESVPAGLGIKKMIEALKAPAPGSAVPAPGSAAPGASTPVNPPVAGVNGGNAAAASQPGDAVLLPKAMPANDPVAVLLRQGEFAKALEETDKILATPTQEMSLRVFQRGMAQMGLAQAGKDENLYKDAGLSFMRVVIYFPKSAYLGPSLLEAGLVHQKIGRPDLARKLWDRARLMLSDEDDPQLVERVEKLVAGTASEPTP